MTQATVFVAWALVLGGSDSGGMAPAARSPVLAEGGAQATAEAARLTGRWIYNSELSDDARDRMREVMEKDGKRGEGRRPPMGPGGPGGGAGPPGGGTRGPGGRMGPGGMGGGGDPREAMRAILDPAEELVVSESPNEIAIDEVAARVRRLHPDGRRYKTDGGSSETKTSWKDGRLVVETKGGRGASVAETWELVPDGSRLIVNVETKGGFGPDLALKRVYDRAPTNRTP